MAISEIPMNANLGMIHGEFIPSFEVSPEKQANAEDAFLCINELVRTPKVPFVINLVDSGVHALNKHEEVNPRGVEYGVGSIFHKVGGVAMVTSLLKPRNGKKFGIKPVIYAETHLFEEEVGAMPVNGDYDRIVRPFGDFGAILRPKVKPIR